MSQQDELVERGRRLLLNNYRQAPVVMARGEGCALWDVEGRRYLDMTAGVAVCVLGHGHAGLAEAISRAGAPPRARVQPLLPRGQLQLAEALSRRAFKGRAFFCNSGTEANEAALKLARRYQVTSRKQPERVELVAFENSFHGRTMGSLCRDGAAEVPRRASARWSSPCASCRSATSPPRAPRSPTRPAPSSSSRSRPRAASCCRRPGYLQELRRLCTDTGTVLIFDEVQTGVGRTGHVLRVRERGRRPRRRDAGQGAGAAACRSARCWPTRRSGAASSRARTRRRSAATRSRRRRRCTCSRRIDEQACSSAAATSARISDSALLRLAERRRPQTRGARGRGLLQGLVLDGEAGARSSRARRARAARVGRRRQRRAPRAAAHRQRRRRSTRRSRSSTRVAGRSRDERSHDAAQALPQLLGPARRRHRGADPARRGVPPAALAARAARDAARAACSAWCSRRRRRARAPASRSRCSSSAATRSSCGTQGSQLGRGEPHPRHRARAVGLLPRHHDPHLRPGSRRRDGALRVGPGHQRPHRPAAPLPGAGRSADGRAALPATRGDVGRRCAR